MTGTELTGTHVTGTHVTGTDVTGTELTGTARPLTLGTVEEALEALRAIRREPRRGEVVRLSACDPLNLVGVITPGPRVPAVLGNVVAFRDGVPIDPAAPAADPTSADLAAIS